MKWKDSLICDIKDIKNMFKSKESKNGCLYNINNKKRVEFYDKSDNT